MKKLLILVLISLSVVSCEKTRLKKTLRNMMNSEIVFPDEMYGIANGRDTIMSPVGNSLAKLVIYFDPQECASCRAGRLTDYNELLALSTASRNMFEPVFIFSPDKKKIKELKLNLKNSLFNYPVFIDSTGIFAETNKVIPDDNRFHAFLLDADNQIVVIGNPTGGERLRTLCNSAINELLNNNGKLRVE